MDVNQTTSIAPVHQDAKRSPQHRDPDDQRDDNDKQNSNPSGSWREDDAVDVDAGLMSGMTAEAQAMIDSLNRQIEPLRAELELARHREAHFCELAARHSFLDIPCRREFLREMNHVLTHIDHLTVPPSVIMLHVSGTENVRLSVGRLGLDQILRDVTDTFTKVLQPTDILGSLGGSDFGVILLSGDETSSAETAEKLKETIRTRNFIWASRTFTLDVTYGMATLTAGESAEAVLDTADRKIRL